VTAAPVRWTTYDPSLRITYVHIGNREPNRITQLPPVPPPRPRP
jgi:hypothetical protein